MSARVDDAELTRLRDAWDASKRELDAATGDALWPASDAEQAAYDALIDYVEANGYNYTEHDPRPS